MVGQFAGEHRLIFGIDQNKANGSFFQKLGGIDFELFQRILFKRLGVHKMVTHIVLVEKLVFPGFHPHRVDLGTGWEGIFEDPTVGQTFELGPYKGCSFAGLHVKEFNDLVDVVVELETEAVAKFGGGCHKKDRFITRMRS
jgi:hypothetical protein